MSKYEYNKKYAKKYIGALDNVALRLPKGDKDIIKAHATARGESVNGFILRAITATLDSWARRYYRSDYTTASPWRGRVACPRSPPGIRPGEGGCESLAVLI